MMERLRLWCERNRVLAIILSVWLANIVTTWAQTKVFQADTASSTAASTKRWADSRKEWAGRIDVLSNRVAGVEAQCARR